jgi:hypothetical protein
MAKHKQTSGAERTVSRDEFVKNPGAVLARAKAGGPITVLDKNGRARATISAPSDRRDVDLD